MGLHRNVELKISGTKVPKMKHNLRQEKLYSTVTLYSDQPTHKIAPECGIHLLGIQNAQSKSLWHLTEKGNKSKFHYFFKLLKLSYSKIRQFIWFNKIVQITSKPKCYKKFSFAGFSTDILGQSNLSYPPNKCFYAKGFFPHKQII